MIELKNLYDERAKAVEEEQSLIHKMQQDGEWHAERDQEFDRLEQKIKGLDKQIAAAKREEQDAANNADAGPDSTNSRTNEERYAKEVFPKLFKNGLDFSRLSQEERAVVEDVHTRAPVGTGQQGGSAIVPTELQDRIIEKMKNMEGVREVAMVQSTPDGNQFRFPVSDYLSEVGEQIDENPSSDTAELNPSFTEKQIEAFTYSSKEIRMSRQILQDTPFDILSYVENVIAMRLFNVLNPLFTTGSGSSEPEGIVTGASLNTTAKNSSSIVREDLVNTVHNVARPYRTNAAWMVSDEFVSAVRKLSIGSSDARPLYQPSANADEPDRIEGYPIAINNDLKSIATGNVVATFGDHTQYMVRDVQGAELQRLQEIHARKNQDSFIYFERHDGKLLDTNAINKLTMK